ncbi:hypothetical protein Tco_0595277 [Tanacetum coccineum]
MANQEQNLPQQEQPFVAAKQVSFNLEDIILNTNNEVALIHPEHTNKEYFKCVSDFISKCCLRKPFMKSPNMYQEYLVDFWYLAKALENSKVSFLIPIGGIYGEVRLNTFRNSIGAYYLPHSSEYVAPPSIDVVRKWFPMIGYMEECFGGKTGGFDQITNKDVIMLYSLANGIHIDYANIFWEDIILKLKKKQREKALKPNQPVEPPFTAHILVICALDKPVVFKAPKTSLRAESVSQGVEPIAKTGHKKPVTSSKKTFVSRKEATKVSTHVDTEMHKEDQQATGGPTSLGVTSEERANPQLSSGMSALNLNKPIFSASFIIHSESASGHDVSADFTAEADPGLSAPNDSIPPQQGMDEGTKNTSYDHIFAGTDPHVLADQTKSVSEGLETVLTQPTTEKGASSTAIHGDKEEASTAIHGDKEEASSTIKLEDLAKLVSQIQPSFKDLDSPEDDPVIIVDESDEDEPNAKTEDTSVPRSSSPRSSQIQELTNQVLILQSQKHKLELEKNKAEAEAALLKAQPSFPNVEQLNELLVKSLQNEFLKILSSHDFSSSLPTKLKDLPIKFNELTKEIKGLKTQVHELEIELPKELKEIPTKLEDFTKTATSLTSHVAELKTLKFTEVLESTSTKARDQSVPSAGKADTMPAEAEKESTESNSDDKAHVTGSMVTSSKVVHKYYNYELQYDRYCDKLLNRRVESRIANCDVLTRKGLITFKVYREDGTYEVIPNFKVSDLHLSEWREMMKACLDRKGKGWQTIYDQIQTRMDYLHTTKAELGINLDIPLSMQDPLDKLNDLANKKKNMFMTSMTTSKQPKGLSHQQDFVTIENLKDFSNAMLYTIQEIFFRRHQRPGVDDHARTFSSLLLAEVDKRNLNLLKHMRTIEQLIPSASALQVLRRLGSIFTLVYEAVQKLKKALGKRLLYAKRNKEISFRKGTSKVSKEVHSLFLKGLYLVLKRLGSIFTSAYAAVQKLKKDSWLELQFSFIDNSKLNVRNLNQHAFFSCLPEHSVYPKDPDHLEIPRDQHLSSCEAAWRIFKFDIHHRFLAVERLPFHLPNQQSVVFDPSESIDIQLENTPANTLKFLAWMECNKTDSAGQKLLYV